MTYTLRSKELPIYWWSKYYSIFISTERLYQCQYEWTR